MESPACTWCSAVVGTSPAFNGNVGVVAKTYSRDHYDSLAVGDSHRSSLDCIDNNKKILHVCISIKF